jgi:hypothetical protein
MRTIEETRTGPASVSKTDSPLDDFVILITTLITVIGSVWFLVLALDVLSGPPSIQGFPQSDPRYGVWIQGVQFNQIILSLSTTAAGLTIRGLYQTVRTLWKYSEKRKNFSNN